MSRRPVRQKLTAAPAAPGSLLAFIGQFLRWMEATNYSEESVSGREWHLYHFSVWCEERRLLRPQEITKPILERYKRFCFTYRKANGQPLSFCSQHGRLVAIKALFKWLMRNNHLLYNPASDIDLPRREHRLPHTLTQEEVDALLLAPDLSTPGGVRDRAMLETFYSTGIRRRELSGLILQSIDRESGTLMVRKGKGRRDRVVPIGERALVWVNKYLADVRPTFVVEPDEGILFLTNRGQGFNPDQLSTIVRIHIEKAGIQKPGSCHLLRHSMATHMLEHGADVRFIQQMLGHADLTSTQVYTQVSIRMLKQVHERTHPSAKLGRMETTATEAEKAELLAALAVEAGENGGES